MGFYREYVSNPAKFRNEPSNPEDLKLTFRDARLSELRIIVEQELQLIEQYIADLKNERDRVKKAIRAVNRSEILIKKLRRLAGYLTTASDDAQSIRIRLYGMEDSTSELAILNRLLSKIMRAVHKIHAHLSDERGHIDAAERTVEQIKETLRKSFDIGPFSRWNPVRLFQRHEDRMDISGVIRDLRNSYSNFVFAYEWITEWVDFSEVDIKLIEESLSLLAQIEPYIRENLAELRNAEPQVREVLSSLIVNLKEASKILQELAQDEDFIKVTNIRIKTDIRRERAFMEAIKKFLPPGP